MRQKLCAAAVFGLALGLSSATSAQETASAQPEATVGGLLSTPRAPQAKSLDADLDAIAAQLGSIATSKAVDDDVVKRAVEQGKRAVLQATRAFAAGDQATGARKKAIARAALELASRAAARREETRAESAAAQNATHAEQEQAQAAVLLEQARAQLKSLGTEAP